VEAFACAAHSNTMAFSDAMTAAVLANVEITVAAPQDVLPMARVTHFALETVPTRVPRDAFEASRMLTLMIILQIGEHCIDTPASLRRK